jgi:hypothetical protein
LRSLHGISHQPRQTVMGMEIAFRFDNHPVTKQGIMSATNLARLARLEAIQPIYAMEILAQTLRHKCHCGAVDFGSAESAKPVAIGARSRCGSPRDEMGHRC